MSRQMKMHSSAKPIMLALISFLVIAFSCISAHSFDYNRKKWTAEDFHNELMSLTKKDVRKILGSPTTTMSYRDDLTGYWTYDHVQEYTIVDANSGKKPRRINIFFENGKVKFVRFNFR
jgi:outer membrane protein assembly factor BamE (lipoprotein component of BamABCDE complex)